MLHNAEQKKQDTIEYRDCFHLSKVQNQLTLNYGCWDGYCGRHNNVPFPQRCSQSNLRICECYFIWKRDYAEVIKIIDLETDEMTLNYSGGLSVITSVLYSKN